MCFTNIFQIQCYFTLSTPSKIFSRRYTEMFFFLLIFFEKTGLIISFKLSQRETIWMKCQILFSGENKKKISSICRLLN